MLQSECVSLCWDVTALRSVHINEVHVNTDSGSYLLSVAELPEGTTHDYVKHIIDTLEYSTQMYAEVNSLKYFQVLNNVRQRIASTLSNRAAVNHWVSAEIGKFVGHHVLDLNCNIHPLDSLSIAFRKLCKTFDSEHNVTSHLYRTEAALVKVIINM